MKVILNYTKSSIKFFKRHSNTLTKTQADKLIIKALQKVLLHHDVNVNVKAMKGDYLGYFRIRYRKVRIIIFINDEGQITVVTVENIGFRGRVYR